MPIHKSSDYKLSVVKYYLSHSKNQVQTCKIFGVLNVQRCKIPISRFLIYLNKFVYFFK